MMNLIAAATALLAICFCGFPAAAEERSVCVIPEPQKMTLNPGSFHLETDTKIICDEQSKTAAELLANQLRSATGYKFPITIRKKSIAPNAICLRVNSSVEGNSEEGYLLHVTANHADIEGLAPAGVFYGTQTFLQLLPASVFSLAATSGEKWLCPCVEIVDQPRFRWRGFMLDASRHFFTKPEIKQVLDEMAMHKLNMFHWHLVDDQGWRIEIKKYPRLTEIGAWRKSVGFGLDPSSTTAYGKDGRYGGFYTQSDVREIVTYANARNITIVPEIEMPGHSNAALAAYPQYSCTGGPFTTDKDAGVFNGVYCVGNEETFEFLQGVLSEIFTMFPGEYVHIGGDEVPPDNWQKCPKCQARMKAEKLKDPHELEGYLIQRINTFLAEHQKILIGWSEIGRHELPPDAVLMDWIGGGKEAVLAGHDAIMTPRLHCYLDYAQSSAKDTEPRAQPDVLTLKSAYEFEPVPNELPEDFLPHVAGGQGNLWTEFIPSLSQAQYMMFPRLSALAEVLWSDKKEHDWQAFLLRLPTHCQRLAAMKVNYRAIHSDDR